MINPTFPIKIADSNMLIFEVLGLVSLPAASVVLIQNPENVIGLLLLVLFYIFLVLFHRVQHPTQVLQGLSPSPF